MILRLRSPLSQAEEAALFALARERGYTARLLDGARRLMELRSVAGGGQPQDRACFEDLAAVEAVLDSADAPELFRRQPGRDVSLVRAGDALFGGGHVSLIAGPCAVESEERVLEIARRVRASGATLLRGGAFKPRTSPYSFQGLGHAGLELLARVRTQVGIGVVTEVLDPRDLEAVCAVADVLQIGARNMANYALLREVGQLRHPVLVKRGPAATAREFLLAAEYVLAGGNENVLLCERGVRGFDRVTRNVLDLGTVAWLKETTHLPVLVDPSHAAGRADLVLPLAKAGRRGRRRRFADRGPSSTLRGTLGRCPGHLSRDVRSNRGKRLGPRPFGRQDPRHTPRSPDPPAARRRGRYRRELDSVRKPYLAGNWKMNLDRASGLALARAIAEHVGERTDRDVAVIPPFVYLAEIAQALKGSPVRVGAQNVCEQESGAFTGEISTAMLTDIGVDLVVIGHSERRHIYGEDDALVNAKVHAALAAGLEVILCVGETIEERQANQTEEVVRRQLSTGLQGVEVAQMDRLTVAYEPVWAIGTGHTATPEQAGEVHHYLRGLASGLYDAGCAERLRIQYGGSVKPANAGTLLAVKDVDGALVGGASLTPEAFIPIIDA